MKVQKGFTLIELMVVIVIIGILSALAIPKMFGVSAKAKAAELPTIVANWETLQSAYGQETGAAGTWTQIGFQAPGAVAGTTTWFTYTNTAAAPDVMTGTVNAPGFGGALSCAGGQFWQSTFTVGTDSFAHALPVNAPCAAYTPNF